MQSTRTAVVPAPVDQVWSVVADHEGMSKWGPGLSATLLQRGTTERNGVGAVRKIAPPKPAPAIVEEIIGFEPSSRLRYKALSGVPLKNYQGEIALRPVGNGTEITYTISADQRLPLVDRVAVGAIARTLLAALVRQVGKTAR
ncbi:MAG: SRPBCC family protein [Jatrophihabitans sp.]|uniref:SRPBCC family protein n=1 Tax=Jatrophihabitans sp. TaxID=1932789 RepID=UPI003F806B60